MADFDKIPRSKLWNDEKNELTVTGAILLVFICFKFLKSGCIVLPEDFEKFIDMEK